MTRTATSLLTLALLLAAVPASAQAASDPASEARLQFGPLGLTPSIAIENVGIDTNVFNDTEDPKEDFTATSRPQLDVWLRLGRATLSVAAAVEGVYFKRYSDQSSVNPDGAAALEYRGNRVGVFAGGGLRRTRQRPGFEIDVRVRQVQESLMAGGDIRLGGKTAVGVTIDRTRARFEEDATVSGTSLRETLNRRETTASAFVSYDVTPLTSVLVRADVQRDTFDASPLRNSRRVRITPGVEFKPFALITGSASVGYHSFEPLDSAQTPFTGTFASVDLAYTLLGRTRFAVQANRDVEYSYRPSQPYYVITGVTGSISQAVSGSWMLTARGGRHRLNYGGTLFDASTGASRRDMDIVHLYGAGIAWQVSPDVQLGVNADYQRRQTADPARRAYEGLRAGSFLTYGR